MVRSLNLRGWRIILFALLVTVLATTANAQLSTATLFGTVTDSTGAVVPHATVTLIQTDTNFTRTITTKDDGSYHEEFLPIGPYKILVSAPGFRSLERKGIVLAVMQNSELTLTLQTGATV